MTGRGLDRNGLFWATRLYSEPRGSDRPTPSISQAQLGPPWWAPALLLGLAGCPLPGAGVGGKEERNSSGTQVPSGGVASLGVVLVASPGVPPGLEPERSSWFLGL